MKQIFLGILIVLIGFFAFTGKAQVPWNIAEKTNDSNYIYIQSNKLTIDGIATTNYAIGAFYDSLGFSKCAGFGVVPGDTSFIVFGNYPSGYGYTNGKAFHFKIWNTSSSCELDLDTTGVFMPSYSKTFTKNGYSQIDSTKAYASSISYASASYCRYNQFEQPVISNSKLKVSYSSGVGLSIDNTTGIIDLASSLSGKYTIHFITDACLVKDSFIVTINPVPTSNITSTIIDCDGTAILDAGKGSVSYNWSTGESTQSIEVNKEGHYSVMLENAYGCKTQNEIDVMLTKINANYIQYLVIEDCKAGGGIKIDSTTISGGKGSYTYILKSLSGSKDIVSNSYVIKNIPTGSYSLYVRDDLNCEVLAANSISINTKCQLPLLVFDNSGNTEGYFIPQAGTAKIYDKFGKLQKTLEVPAIWDGTNNSGELVPMGDYLIIANDTDKIRITVIK